MTNRMENMKNFYMSIYALQYSPCGNYIAAGNNYGKIALFSLIPAFHHEDDNESSTEQKKPIFLFQAHEDDIYALTSTDDLLISGSIGKIRAWKWNDLRKKNAQMVWEFNIPQGDNLDKQEVNCLAVSSKENECLLFAGCGDKKIYCFDIDTLKQKSIFLGHTEGVHCIILGNSNFDCITGSEDGSVRFWDARQTEKEAQIIEPSNNQMTARPQIGKWIGCVDFSENEDWLVCGGAPVLSVWDLRSLAPAVTLPKANATYNVARFYDGTIISGGSEACVNHWSLNGEQLAEVPTSYTCIYDLSISSNRSKQILSSAGGGCKIDVCADFRFKDFSFIFS